MPRVALILFLVITARAQDTQTFILTGNAVNSVTGQPISRAEITLQGIAAGPGMTNMAQTAADISGHFVIVDLPAGTYTLNAAKRGFLPSPSQAFKIGPSQNDITLKLAPFGRITGTVLDENGDPMLNASIQLFHSAIQNGRRQLQPSNSAQTNDLGQFHIASLAPGRYFVSATAQPDQDGVSYPRTFFGGTADLSSSVPIELPPGGTSSASITLRPTRAFKVRGTIQNLPERMHPYLNIVRKGASLATNEGHATSVDISTGAFEFRGITPGVWVINAGCFDRNTQLSAYVEVIVSNDDAEGVTVPLTPAVPITGVIRSDQNNGTPPNLRGVYLAMRPAGDGAQASLGVQVKEDGSFSIMVNQPGDYYLAVRAPEPAFVKQVMMGGQNVAGLAFPVSQNGSPGPFEIIISAGGGEVDGTVTDGNTPAVNATVLLLGSAGEKLARSDYAGRFQLPALAPGDYNVYAFTNIDDVEYTNQEAMRNFSSTHVSVSEGAKQQLELKLNRTVY